MRFRSGFAVHLACILGSLAACQAAVSYPVSEPVHRVRVEENIMVPMRDGTRLAADIYVPEGTGPYPALLQRTPYNKKGRSLVELAHYYATRGYVVVLQDTRGRFASEGEFRNYLDDGWGVRQDGYDTIEWVARQSWCTGKVGTFGISYAGTIQYLTAATRPPHLTAMFVGPAAADFYQEVRYQGGALMGHAVTWQVSNQAFTRSVEDPADWNTLLHATSREEAFSLENFIDPTFLEWIRNPADGPFWWQMSINRKFDQVAVPTYHHGGWFDRFSRGNTQAFSGIASRGFTAARAAQRLIMGPWPHSDRGERVVGGVDFGPEAAVDINLLRLRWFDYWLKGMANGIMDEPPVAVFMMGRNRWRHEQQWPPAQARATHFYLRSGPGGAPAYSLNDGGLSLQPPASGEKPDTYTAHPKDPLPTVGGDTRFGEQGPLDQTSVERKSLTYTTDVLREDLGVLGNPKVTLFFSSSAPDTDVVAILADVHPDGTSRILTRGLLRAKYHRSFERADLLQPGKVYRLRMELGPTGHVFRAGHRVRLSLAGSSYPAWIPNANSGRDFAEGGAARTALNSVWHDRRQDSHLELPVVDADSGEERASGY